MKVDKHEGYVAGIRARFAACVSLVYVNFRWKKLEKPTVKSSKRSEPLLKKATTLYDNSDEEPDPEDDNLGADVKSIETELQLYLDCNRAGDVLRYWEQQKAVFPRLYTITRKVFCVPATTASVEKLFSIAGFHLGRRRLRLSDANFEEQNLAH